MIGYLFSLLLPSEPTRDPRQNGEAYWEVSQPEIPDKMAYWEINLTRDPGQNGKAYWEGHRFSSIILWF